MLYHPYCGVFARLGEATNMQLALREAHSHLSLLSFQLAPFVTWNMVAIPRPSITDLPIFLITFEFQNFRGQWGGLYSIHGWSGICCAITPSSWIVLLLTRSQGCWHPALPTVLLLLDRFGTPDS